MLAITKKLEKVGEDVMRMANSKILLRLKGTKCSICLESKCNYQSKCGHSFHRSCLSEWMSFGPGDFLDLVKTGCPVCRTKIKRPSRKNAVRIIVGKDELPRLNNKSTYRVILNNEKISKLGNDSVYRICNTCPTYFEAGPKSCSENRETFPEKCDSCRTGQICIRCPKCKMGLEHSGGCRSFTCCRYSYPAGGGCRGTNCDHGSTSFSPFCGHRWQLSDKDVKLSREAISREAISREAISREAINREAINREAINRRLNRIVLGGASPSHMMHGSSPRHYPTSLTFEPIDGLDLKDVTSLTFGHDFNQPIENLDLKEVTSRTIHTLRRSDLLQPMSPGMLITTTKLSFLMIYKKLVELLFRRLVANGMITSATCSGLSNEKMKLYISMLMYVMDMLMYVMMSFLMIYERLITKNP